MIENLRPLTQEQRQGARQSARNAVIRAPRRNGSRAVPKVIAAASGAV